MNKIESKTVKVNDWELFTNLKNEFKTINDKRIPKNTIRKINTILNSIPADELVELSLSQGDFTQWNMFEKMENYPFTIGNWLVQTNQKLSIISILSFKMMF